MADCTALTAAGKTCRAAALRERPFCRMHDPDQAEAVAEGRRIGGLRRRREVSLAHAYDLSGLASAAEVVRLLEIAVFDTLSLENSPARSRAIAQISSVAIRAHEVMTLDERLRLLEQQTRQTGRRAQ